MEMICKKGITIYNATASLYIKHGTKCIFGTEKGDRLPFTCGAITGTITKDALQKHFRKTYALADHLNEHSPPVEVGR